MDANYFTLSLDNVSAEIEDVLVADLFSVGAGGVQENLKFTQQGRGYEPEVVDQMVKALFVYFEAPPAPQDLEWLQLRYPSVSMTLDERPRVDWLARWKEQWKPFELVESVWVIPEWEKDSFVKEDIIPLFIEPGMAFGTGTHATTQLASGLIQKLNQKHNIEKSLDVGTGSGILAMLLSKLGSSEVTAYDNQEESIRVFKENCKKNQTTIQWKEDWNQIVPGSLDLCVANIIDGVLLDLKPQFQTLVAKYYIFTGVLEEREESFLKEMLTDWPLELVERQQQDEWVGYLFRGPQ